MLDEIEIFRLYLTTERGLSLKTLEAYLGDIGKFSLFCQGKPLVSVVEEDLMAFFIKEREISASSTLRRRFMALKVFYTFLHKEGLLNRNIFKFLSSPKMWQKVPKALQEREIERLLAQPDETPIGKRDKAILELLYGAGLRVSELVGLTLYSVDEEGVRVMGKGSKERVVPIGEKGIESLDRYLATREGGARADPLFLNKKGKPVDRIDVWHIIKKYSKQAGLQTVVSPHTLRHSYATHLLNRGADIRVIQDLLGHQAIASTERYTQVSNRELKEKFKRAHPALEGI